MTYHLSPSLDQLRSEINARWSGRDKASDGWIGDAAHSSRTSDHNPDADGSVNACDFDKDGIDVVRVIACALADRRTRYVIWAGNIWTRGPRGWIKAAYHGANGHYHHLHISIKHGPQWEDDRSPWGIGATPARPTAAPKPAPTPLLEEEDDMREKLDAISLRYLARKIGDGPFAEWGTEITCGRKGYKDYELHVKGSPEAHTASTQAKVKALSR